MNTEGTYKSTTVGSIVYLLLSMPLGILYFTLTVVGLSIGLGTLVIWIGLPILFGTFVAIRGMAAIERRLVVTLLRFPLPYAQRRYGETRRTFMQYVKDMLRDPLTWTSTIYMLIKLPLGILSFTLALVLPIMSTAITLLPLAYLVNLLVNTILLKNGIQSSGTIIPYFIEVNTTFDPIMFLRSFVGVPIGLVLWYVTRLVLNGIALGSAELVHAMLSEDGPAMPVQPSRMEMPMMVGQYEQQLYMSQENHS